MEFEDAVMSLAGMFNTVEPDVIRSVLEGCQGQMEVAVEQLLMLSGGAESGEGAGGSPDPSMDVAPTSEVVGSLGGSGSSSAAPVAFRHPLPDDFLAVPSSSSGSSSTAAAQLAQDEAIAQMMSDELFMQQLQSDPEFAAYLGQEAAYLDTIATGGAPPAEEAAATESLKSKFSKMGANLKRRFASFSKKKSSPAGSSGDGGAYTSLLDTTDEEGTTTIDLDVTGGPFTIGDDSDDEGTLHRRPVV